MATRTRKQTAQPAISQALTKLASALTLAITPAPEPEQVQIALITLASVCKPEGKTDKGEAILPEGTPNPNAVAFRAVHEDAIVVRSEAGVKNVAKAVAKILRENTGNRQFALAWQGTPSGIEQAWAQLRPAQSAKAKAPTKADLQAQLEELAAQLAEAQAALEKANAKKSTK